jgi:hypothetical protein
MDKILCNIFQEVLLNTDYVFESYTDVVTIRRVRNGYQAVYFSCSKNEFTVDGVIKYSKSVLQDRKKEVAIKTYFSPEQYESIVESTLEIINIVNSAIRKRKIQLIRDFL